MAATIEELKDIIIDLKMDLVRESILSGNCPYAYYHRENPVGDCGSVSCGECKRNFLEDMKKDIVKEVKAL